MAAPDYSGRVEAKQVTLPPEMGGRAQPKLLAALWRNEEVAAATFLGFRPCVKGAHSECQFRLFSRTGTHTELGDPYV